MAGSTALQIAAAACNDAGLDQTLSSFTMTEWPYSAVLDIMNAAISECNRAGSFRFCETILPLTYTPGSYTYNLSTIATNLVMPERILRIRRELVTSTGNLTEMSFYQFQNLYRTSTIPTARPVAWAKYGMNVYLNSIPDQDYSLNMYYYTQIQPIVVGTNDNSVTLFPVYHEDVLRDLTKALLLKEMGRTDFATQYQLAVTNVKALVARSNEDTGLGSSMPRSF